MKAWHYYALSVVLVLLTVPMYRRILAARADAPASSPSQVSVPSVSSVDCVSGRLYARLGADSVFALMHDGQFVPCDDHMRMAVARVDPLPAGYFIPLPPEDRCYGGFVLRVQHSEYSNIVGVDGRPRRCRGRMAAPDYQ